GRIVRRIVRRAGIGKAVTLSADSAQRQESRLAKYLIHVRTEQEDLFTSTHRRDDLTSTPESAFRANSAPVGRQSRSRSVMVAHRSDVWPLANRCQPPARIRFRMSS